MACWPGSPPRRSDRRVGLLYALIQLSSRPEPIGWGQASGWAWAVPIGLVVAASVGLAVWAAWHGLLDHAVLPPPAVGGDV